MLRRKLLALVQLICLVFSFVAISLGLFPHATKSFFERWDMRNGEQLSSPNEQVISTEPATILPPETIFAHVQAILHPDDQGLPRLECPPPALSRYGYLRVNHTLPAGDVHYFLALNLRNCLPLLPTLLGSIIEAIRFLGPKHCSLSIVEGNSPDGTADVLSALRKELGDWTTTNFVLSYDLNPLEGDRFPRLAQLRNLALAPVKEHPDRHSNATVVFINDVALCSEDILELVHQKAFQEADMTCAFDWIGGGNGNDDQPVFYDVYIARGINGDIFFNIPPDTTSWQFAQTLFWNDKGSQARVLSHQPTQVFACWNGAVAFTAALVLENNLTFRAANTEKGECHQGEPQLFCKDMWYHGFGRIAMVPSINLEYTVEKGKYIKGLKGFASQWTSTGHSDGEKISSWSPPPDHVKCMRTFDQQSWRPWNETLV